MQLQFVHVSVKISNMNKTVLVIYDKHSQECGIETFCPISFCLVSCYPVSFFHYPTVYSLEYKSLDVLTYYL